MKFTTNKKNQRYVNFFDDIGRKIDAFSSGIENALTYLCNFDPIFNVVFSK